METPTYKISYDPPPNYAELQKHFGVNWEKMEVVAVYGDTIHQSFARPMDGDLRAHEENHVRQQAAYPGGAEAWWKEYVSNKHFRIEQELECYRIQYAWAKRNIKNRQRVWEILRHCATEMGGPLYGNVMTVMEAMRAIQEDPQT